MPAHKQKTDYELCEQEIQGIERDLRDLRESKSKSDSLIAIARLAARVGRMAGLIAERDDE